MEVMQNVSVNSPNSPHVHLRKVSPIALRRTTLYWWNDSLTRSHKEAVTIRFERIMKHVQAKREATPICPPARLHLGKRGAVNQHLPRALRSRVDS